MAMADQAERPRSLSCPKDRGWRSSHLCVNLYGMEMPLWTAVALVGCVLVLVQALYFRRVVLQIYKRLDVRFDQLLARFDAICRQLDEIRVRLAGVGPRARSVRTAKKTGCLSLQQVSPIEAMRVRRMINRDLRPPRQGGSKRFRWKR